MTELMGRYHAHLHRRNLAARTIAHRVWTVGRLEEHCDGDLLGADVHQIRAWLDSLNLGPRARYAYTSALGTFYGWAHDEQLIDENPMRRLERPKLPQGLPRPAPNADLDEAMAVLPDKPRAMVALAAFAGLRCCEIAGLYADHLIDQGADGWLLFVEQGKGSKERTVPLHPRALRALERHGVPRSGPVFHYHRNPSEPLRPERVSLIGNRALRAAGIGSTMHQFRHWFATELYRASKDLRGVGDLLGHSSMNTTANYTKFDMSHVREHVVGLSWQ